MILEGLLRGSLRRERAQAWHVSLPRRLLGRPAENGAAASGWRLPEQPVEPRVQRVVAAHLGVGPEELTPDVSLADDLAADSLDLV